MGAMTHPLRALTFLPGVILTIMMFSLVNASAGVVIPNPSTPNQTIEPNPAFGSNSASASSWLAGGHAGYNWQRGPVVFGFETDLQGTHLNSSMNGGLSYNPSLAPPPGSFATTSSLIDWYGTFRGRLGLAYGSWLFYGTGGFAYGGVNLNSTFGTLGGLTTAQTSAVNSGWVAGAGIDYRLGPNLTLNLLYQHVDLGSLSASSSTGPFAVTGGSVTIGQLVTAHAQFDAVMAGLTWRFALPTVYGSWAGGYLGGQAGGAWGNNTNGVYTSSATTIISDARLKRDISLLYARSDGLGVYSYKYLWSDTAYVGVLAQEVAVIYPDAVVHDQLTGYLSVDYARLNADIPMPMKACGDLAPSLLRS